jgi:hypothetical protein
MNQELEFLLEKKLWLKEQLYKPHLKNATYWQKMCPVHFCTVRITTYVFLLWHILLLDVLKKCWCLLPEDGDAIAPKHIGAM